MPLTTRSVLCKEEVPYPPSAAPAEPYETREIELPDWLTTEAYCTQYHRWGELWICDADPEWPESWQRLLSRLDNDLGARIACIELLRVKKFRSEFRRSLKERLVTWLEDPEERYPSPFTHKQWDKLIQKWTTWKLNRIRVRLFSNPLPIGAHKLVRSKRPKRSTKHD
jgi:hypothetical protein